MCQALFGLSPLILTSTLYGRCYYYVYVSDKETEAQKVCVTCLNPCPWNTKKMGPITRFQEAQSLRWLFLTIRISTLYHLCCNRNSNRIKLFWEEREWSVHFAYCREWGRARSGKIQRVWDVWAGCRGTFSYCKEFGDDLLWMASLK